MGVFGIEICHSVADPGAGLRSGLECSQEDAFVSHAPPQPFDHPVVDPATAPVHRDFDTCVSQRNRPVNAVNRLPWSHARQGIAQHARAEDLIGTGDGQPVQQVRPDLLAWILLAGVQYLVDRRQSREPHQPAHTMAPASVTPPPHVSSHLAAPVPRRFQEPLVPLIEPAFLKRPAFYLSQGTGGAPHNISAFRAPRQKPVPQVFGVTLYCRAMDNCPERQVLDARAFGRAIQVRERQRQHLTLSTSADLVVRPLNAHLPAILA